MKCPMTFSDPCYDAERDCIREECAWWVVHRGDTVNDVRTAVGCSVPFIAAAGLYGETAINRGSKEEDE